MKSRRLIVNLILRECEHGQECEIEIQTFPAKNPIGFYIFPSPKKFPRQHGQRRNRNSQAGEYRSVCVGGVVSFFG